MRQYILNLYDFFWLRAYSLKNVIKLTSHYKYYCKGNCYFPEYNNKRRSSLMIYFIQLMNVIKYGDVNDFFYLYGFDIKNFRKRSDFIDNMKFMTLRQENNMNPLSDVLILRNKILFGYYAEILGIPTPQNLGIIKNKKYQNFKSNNHINIYDDNMDVFIKAIDGECGEGVYHAKGGRLGNGKLLEEVISSGLFLVQEKIPIQHKAISAIYQKSINTIRLITIYDKSVGGAIPFSAVLRDGANGNEVDNWAAGGLAVGIDMNKGVLRKYGFYKPKYGTKTDRHPNSNFIFDNAKIPFFSEAVSMAIYFHNNLKVHSIGWDIAITETGPCFIEGNDNYEISLNQAANSEGYNKSFNQLFK